MKNLSEKGYSQLNPQEASNYNLGLHQLLNQPVEKIS